MTGHFRCLLVLILLAPMMESSVTHAQSAATDSVDALPWQITTTPPGARIHVNWDFLGTTPLSLAADQLQADDLFIASLDGHRPVHRVVIKPRSLYLRLSPERDYPPRRMLLRILGEDTEEFAEQMMEGLTAADLFIHPMVDTDLLEQHLLALGNRDRRPLLDWARGYFESAYWLVINLPGSDPRVDLSARLVPTGETVTHAADGEPQPADTLDTSVEVRLIDLRAGTFVWRAEFDGDGIDQRNGRRRKVAQRRLRDAIVVKMQEWITAAEARQQVLTVIDSADADDGDQDDQGAAAAEIAEDGPEGSPR